MKVDLYNFAAHNMYRLNRKFIDGLISKEVYRRLVLKEDSSTHGQLIRSMSFSLLTAHLISTLSDKSTNETEPAITRFKI